MKRLLRTLAFAHQILSARRQAVALMTDPMRVWPSPGRPVPDLETELPPDRPPRVEPVRPRYPIAPDTPMGPDLLLDGQELDWYAVSGCVCKSPGLRHLVCPAHPEEKS